MALGWEMANNDLPAFDSTVLGIGISIFLIWWVIRGRTISSHTDKETAPLKWYTFSRCVRIPLGVIILLSAVLQLFTTSNTFPVYIKGLSVGSNIYTFSNTSKAIVTTAECIQKHLMKGCFLYRTGGDEFMVLCPKNTANMKQLHKMIDLIYKAMEQTPYRCSIGMAEYRKGENFNSLCARADEEMYRIKREWKKKGN